MTRNEVPALTRGIVAVIRNQAFIEGLMVGEVPCIRIFSSGHGVEVLVRSDDWAKLVPYLKNGTFDTELLPVVQPGVLHPNTHYDASTGEIWDSELHARVATLLNTLFTVEFPTSNL